MPRKPPTRRPTATDQVTIRNMVQARLLARYGALLNWHAVAAEFGVSAGMAYRVAMDGYEPHGNTIRASLGFPVLKLAPVCQCGEVHTRKTCPHKHKASSKPRTNYKRLAQTATWAAALLLAQRGRARK